MAMFQSPYRFHGSHARKVNRLLSAPDKENKMVMFKFMKDIYVTAPLVGYLYQKRSEPDHEKDPNTGKEYDANIMAEQVLSVNEELAFNFSLIMLLDKEYEPDVESRINKAFRFVGKDPADEARFDEYVLGGVDVLYDNLIEGASDPTEFAQKIFDFVDTINDRYNKPLNLDEIMNSCVK